MPDSFLLALWTISLVMAAVSLLVLATLVIHRLLSSRVRQRRNQRRDEMMTALFLRWGRVAAIWTVGVIAAGAALLPTVCPGVPSPTPPVSSPPIPASL